MRKIWKSEHDWVSAESAEEANKFLRECYGEDYDEKVSETPLPDDHKLAISFPDGMDDGGEFPSRVWDYKDVDVATVRASSTRTYYVVEATARWWAEEDEGIICSEDY